MDERPKSQIDWRGIAGGVTTGVGALAAIPLVLGLPLEIAAIFSLGFCTAGYFVFRKNKSEIEIGDNLTEEDRETFLARSKRQVEELERLSRTVNRPNGKMLLTSMHQSARDCYKYFESESDSFVENHQNFSMLMEYSLELLRRYARISSTNLGKDLQEIRGFEDNTLVELGGIFSEMARKVPQGEVFSLQTLGEALMLHFRQRGMAPRRQST